MNKLTDTKRAQILACLVEGNSIRSTSRLIGCSKDTVVKLLTDVGALPVAHILMKICTALPASALK
jgi:lambda repressor-like predicted transcriptional regulator